MKELTWYQGSYILWFITGRNPNIPRENILEISVMK